MLQTPFELTAGCAALHPPYELAGNVRRAGGPRWEPGVTRRSGKAFELPSVMRDPWAVQGLLDAAVAVPDDIGGNGADKGIERLRADRVHHALAHLLRIETRRGEPFREHR